MSKECSLCYQKNPMTNEKLREWYTSLLHVDSICDMCLENIEKSRKEFMARKNAKEGPVVNVGSIK